ncbi:MAG TPA: hypothetical protein V6C99_12370 [Oculatellaceae cyanobacterium]
MPLPAFLAAMPAVLGAMGKTAAITAAAQMAKNALTPRNGIVQNESAINPLMMLSPGMYLLGQMLAHPLTPTSELIEDYRRRGGFEQRNFRHHGRPQMGQQAQFGQAQQAPLVPTQQVPQATQPQIPQMQPQVDPMNFQTQQLMARRRFQGQGGYRGGMNGY